MSSDEDIILACSAFICMKAALRKRKKRPRRWWISSLFRNRNRTAATDLLYNLRREDTEDLNACCRMPRDVFEELLRMSSRIQKEDTPYRIAIPATERLAVTLNFLATGNSYSRLSLTFKMSKQSISRIVSEVCAAIVDVLQDYIKIPKNEEEWLKVAQAYEEKWNFPHCVGAIGGKCMQTQVPIGSGSYFVNGRATFNVAIVAVVDADYNFLYVDAKCERRISDTVLPRNCGFLKKLGGNTFKLPPTNLLPGRNKIVPYVFLADDAFPLLPNLLIPYRDAIEKSPVRGVYDYRLSRARRVIENTFGIMSTVFQVLQKPMILEPKKAETVVRACMYLHNYLRKNPSSKDIYNPNGTFDSEVNGEVINGSWRQELEENSLRGFPRIDKQASKQAEEVRTEFAEYFSTNGRVSWQNQYE